MLFCPLSLANFLLFTPPLVPLQDASFTNILEEGNRPPPPHVLRKRPVLLRADFVLTKDPKWPYEGQFCGKIDREGSCGKAAGVPS